MESIFVNTSADKEGIYQFVIPQIKALCLGETDSTANLSNIAAALKEAFHWLWIGFYLVKDNTLVVGSFQGPVACTRISLGKGVCGTSWESKLTIVVPNVDEFPGHIACNSASRSEIVVPIINNGTVVAVLDADSEHLAHYDHIDQHYLEELAAFIATIL